MSETSRSAILKRLRAKSMVAESLPDVLHGNWIQYDDPVEQLRKTIESVGGCFHLVRDMQTLNDSLKLLPQFQSARRILSLVDGIPSQFDLATVSDPHELEDLDLLLAEGEFAVAENGAVWVTDQAIDHRVVFFINQHLSLIVRRQNIVHNMHQAYARISFNKPGFGCFISGPSKTADIEQSLVVGAHGCRSMQLFVVDE